MAERFGERIRRIRMARGLGLRETATKVGISATYLSRIETNEEKTPPAEKVIQTLANLLGDNFDELMSLAGRIPTDVTEYFTKDPGLPAFLRTAREKGLTSEQLTRLVTSAKKSKK
jgi:transcriptional regulator with XRE-family HTH domain